MKDDFKYFGYGNPTELELNRLFDTLNDRFFDNSIKKIPVYYNNRMYSTLGVHKLSKIELSYKTHSINEGYVLVSTLLHEMVHSIHRNHGSKFKNRCKEIEDLVGFDIATPPTDIIPYHDYVLECVSCNKQYKDMKDVSDRYSCRCGGKLLVVEENCLERLKKESADKLLEINHADSVDFIE